MFYTEKQCFSLYFQAPGVLGPQRSPSINHLQAKTTVFLVYWDILHAPWLPSHPWAQPHRTPRGPRPAWFHQCLGAWNSIYIEIEFLYFRFFCSALVLFSRGHIMLILSRLKTAARPLNQRAARAGRIPGPPRKRWGGPGPGAPGAPQNIRNIILYRKTLYFFTKNKIFHVKIIRIT